MKPSTEEMKPIPLDIVGSATFGRYPKISIQNTFNMIISDGWLVDYAGYKNVATISTGSQGRAIFTSERLGAMIAVYDNQVFVINDNFTKALVGTLTTFSGDVFIAENNIGQIAICDKTDIWVYNWVAHSFTKAVTANIPPGDDLDFTPGYVSFHDNRFVSVDITPGNPATWRLSSLSDGASWPNDEQHVGQIQTKPDYAVGVVPLPGRANQILVFGRTVCESWFDIGAQLFPYQRNTSVNFDYGCINPATIAYGDNIVAWLGANEKSSPTICYSTAGDVKQISTDGINFKLSNLVNPENSYAFFFRQDGHLIYQITFPSAQDNFSLIYDFNTEKFFTVCDEDMNCHIAKRVTFFNNNYYFVSFNDGNLYQLGTEFTSYDYGSGHIKEIPRIRVCKNIRLPDSGYVAINCISFTIESGTDKLHQESIIEYLATEAAEVLTTEDGVYLELYDAQFPEYNPRVDMTFSYDGGYAFGSSVSYPLNPIGRRKNRLTFWNIGTTNDGVPQFRFWGLGRFVATDGEVSVYR